MKVNGEIVSEVQIVEKVFRTVNIKLGYVVAASEECKDLTTMTIDGLTGSLMAYEQRMLEKYEQRLKGLTNSTEFQEGGYLSKVKLTLAKRGSYKFDRGKSAKNWQDRIKAKTQARRVRKHILGV